MWFDEEMAAGLPSSHRTSANFVPDSFTGTASTLSSKVTSWVEEMAQQVKVPAANPADHSSIPGDPHDGKRGGK